MTPKRFIGIFVLFVIIITALWFFLRGDSLTNKNGNGGTDADNLSSLFPFSKEGTPTLEQKNTGGGAPTFTDIPNPDRAEQINTMGNLTQVTNRLVAGYTPITTTAQTQKKTPERNIVSRESEPTPDNQPELRFVERGTGYVFNINALGKNEKKVSGTTILRASNALFANNGKTVIEQYIKNDNTTVATFVGAIDDTAPSGGKINGEFLPDDIYDITVSSDGNSILFLTPTDEGTAGITIKYDRTLRKQVFTSPFTEWLAEWTKSGMYLFTKASGFAQGYAYKVLNNGTFEKIIGDITGLTIKPSPDGSTILYNSGGENILSLHYIMIKDGTDLDSSLKTLPEKCVWGKNSIVFYCGVPNELPNGIYPDAWYRGQANFSDSIWKVDTKEGRITRLTNNTPYSFDATKLTLDTDEKYLYFVNKKDFSLWSLDLTK